MLIKKPERFKSSEITEEKDFLNRRKFIGVAGTLATAAAAGAAFPRLLKAGGETPSRQDLTPYDLVTSHNNYYEFGTGKQDPKRYAQDFRTEPWTVEVTGHCNRPAVYNLEDILSPHTPEERTYRLRCVEAWSMVIPWMGIPLRDILNRFEPTSQAKFVEFYTLVDPEQMPGQRRRILDWPYLEGLRMDEAMHPLTIMAVGLYGRDLPNQNGAPLRLIVPWKYGFKGGKAIVRINFTETMPRTTWAMAIPSEYGFYANVNPEVDHPRWSQAHERVIGKIRRRRTDMFNGYAEEVGHLYEGMDLTRWY